MRGPDTIVVAKPIPLRDLVARVERDLAEHGRARVVGGRSARRRVRQLGHALTRDGVSWTRGGLEDGRCWLHVCRDDLADAYAWLHLYRDAGLPDWWRSVPVAG